MTQFASPVLHSLLDTDAYKLHMQQAVFHHYYDVHVAAEFRCRGDDLLGIYADAIREQVQAMQHLRLQDDEYQWLSALPFFKADYLNWLREFRFNPEQVTVSNDNGKLDIRLSGPWREVILWEVPLLAVISEMVHRYRSPQADVAQALDTLESKLVDFSALTAGLDMSRFHLMDFGTRRRFSREVQETIVKRLQQESWFVGTSNYDLARRLSLTPMGTQAHEWFQAHQQISPDLANSQRAALAAWLEEYPDQLGIALTDCITMDAFLRDFGPEFATRYQGLRHDSGDPVEWGEKAIAHYQKLVEIVHSYDCRICAQLHQSDSNMLAMLKYVPGVLTKKISMEELRPLLNAEVAPYISKLSTRKIHKIINGFGEAAVLAVKAGFDMVQVHGDRMCGSFSSTIFNHRTDEYGGSAENRARFAVEAVKAIRSRLPEIPIDYKLAVRQEDPHYGNAGVVESELGIFVPLLTDAGVTSFHVTLANHSSLEDTIPPAKHPYFKEQGCFLKFCDEVRQYTDKPITGVGGLNQPDFVEQQLASGRITCAAMSRQLLADPEWPNKVASGQIKEIHRCVRCNKKCLGGLQQHQGTHCIYEKV